MADQKNNQKDKIDACHIAADSPFDIGIINVKQKCNGDLIHAMANSNVDFTVSLHACTLSRIHTTPRYSNNDKSERGEDLT